MTDTIRKAHISGRIRLAAYAAVMTFLLSFAGILILTYAVYHRPSLSHLGQVTFTLDLKAPPLASYTQLYRNVIERNFPTISLVSVYSRDKTLVVTAIMNIVDAELVSEHMRTLIEQQRNEIVQGWKADLASEEKLLADYEKAVTLLGNLPPETFSSPQLLDMMDSYIRNRRKTVAVYQLFDASSSHVEVSYRAERQVTRALETLGAVVFTGFLYCLFMSLLMFRVIVFRIKGPPEARAA